MKNRKEKFEPVPNGPVNMAEKTRGRLQNYLQGLLEEIKQKTKELGGTQDNAADWHDNAAYDLLQQELSVLEAHSATINRALRDAVIVSPRTDTSDIQIGNTVEVLYEGEEIPEQFTILGPQDNTTNSSWVSSETDLAKALIGKQEGARVRMRNGISVTIIKILAGQF